MLRHCLSQQSFLRRQGAPSPPVHSDLFAIAKERNAVSFGEEHSLYIFGPPISRLTTVQRLTTVNRRKEGGEERTDCVVNRVSLTTGVYMNYGSKSEGPWLREFGQPDSDTCIRRPQIQWQLDAMRKINAISDALYMLQDMGGHGPKKPQCIMADRICQGAA